MHAIVVQQAEELKQNKSQMAFKELEKKAYWALIVLSSCMTLFLYLKPLLAQNATTLGSLLRLERGAKAEDDKLGSDNDIE